MTLLSSDYLKERAKEFRTVTGPTNLAPYKVGKRVFKDGYLIYGEGDYVDRETALELGIITEEEAQKEVEKEAEQEAHTEPPVSASRGEWDEYAATIGLDPNDYDNKQQLIDAVYTKTTNVKTTIVEASTEEPADTGDESSDTVG